MKKLLILAGPTASGKSEASRIVAERFGCVIINCDSKQIYQHVPTITDQAEFLRGDPRFRLYSYVHPRDNYSVGLWLEDTKREISLAWNKGLMPIVVGGSGFYISSLIYGLSEIPLVDAATRQRSRTLLSEIGNDNFFELLLQRDANAWRLDRRNTHRLLRAFEVIESTGISIFTWQEQYPRKRLFENCKICVLLPPKEELYPKIDRRLIDMMNSSAISEVEYLMSLNLPEDTQITKAIGVREISEYLCGNINLSQAIETAQRNTRLYAKRQYTWFRRQLPQDSEFFDTQESVVHHLMSVITTN
ncbi:tRNA (adenosine(37)-N6)-dimethylallyltransferase MiaA [Anaplasma capra]|uniref:tRNA (adenosine(37)-N6)-dimethylallyltransferase MiaA n=1 Tax=Anaplasma capra TaxID=1562740 RepID=UPI0021D5B04F|nr:tRNA (adenosine(37)-N6)-dimethylallyltransferase MiaA [Anaplasma capra]MCU7611582.1 tRNA (adenosine(37)-N6)-dimethylallyltransferase MiaA [Anaplasma capra]MCU7611979.1 tRNA (adenosine(37)-N6)-dimethylallyltransferase MiaA [Anaplasma capra]